MNLRCGYVLGLAVAMLCSISLSTFGQETARNLPPGDTKKADATPVPTPRAADGKPDLTGMWEPRGAGGGDGGGGLIIRKDDQGRTSVLDFAEPDADFSKGDALHRAQRAAAPNHPPYKPELLEKVKFLDDNVKTYDGALHCMPPGVPRIGAPREILESPGHVFLLYAGGEAIVNTFRDVPTDNRPHDSDADPSYMGDSVGHWEGDTLVIDSVNFTDKTWLTSDGEFHTDAMHVIERFTRTGDSLKYESTVDDPKAFTHPWVMNPRVLKLNENPKAVFEEDAPCSERDTQHMINSEHH